MIFNSFVLLLIASVFPGVASAQAVDPAASSIIRIGGSGGSLETMRLVALAYKKIHPQAAVTIVPSLGSGGGIKALRAGAIDLAVIGRPLKDSELSPDINATEYARSPLVFATAPSMNIQAITTSELVSLYNGSRTIWPDGRIVRLVLRPEAESDTDIIKSLSLEMNQAVKTAQAREGMIVALTDKASADTLVKIPGAIGAITLAQLISENRPLRPLTLNGVTASRQTLQDGTYGYYKTFFIVSSAKSNLLARQFIVFLRSADAREILEKNGQWVAP